jgi:carbon starvation protein
LNHLLSLRDITLAWTIILYGLAASVLPVWLLLAPRGYLSTFMKLGTIFALAFGIFIVLPNLRMPAISRFVDGSGLIIAGKMFPFCFITIACGAISGFHTLISSGTTPKMLTRESYARPVGYGAMCLESLVAIMALIAACTMDPGVYFAMNVPSVGADSVTRAASITQRLQATGSDLVVSAEAMDRLAAQVKEKTLFSRTGGAATLAAGMASIFSNVTRGRWLDLWYHFAIMFEALFILTTIDAGTRVGRYLLQDALGAVWKPLGETKNTGANVLASVLLVAGWGYFLIQGVRDPLGGVNSLWPLFGIANQMLAAIGLCLGTTIILKMALQTEPKVQSPKSKVRGPALALITLVPLVWLLAVTVTAGVQKIWNADPRIGFLAQASALIAKMPALEGALATANTAGDVALIEQAEKALHTNGVLRFNNLLDAAVAGGFLLLITAIVLLSVFEWVQLLARRKPAVLRETEPVWLPDYAVAESRPLRVAGVAAVAFALAKELSGEAEMDRARHGATLCACEHGKADYPTVMNASQARQADVRAYVEVAEKRFKGVKQCC